MAKNRKTFKRNDTSTRGRRKSKPARSKKKDTTGTYKGIEYDSLEELAMLQWLYELKNEGYIQSIRRATSYLLSNSLVHDYAQQLKTKSKPVQQTLLHGHSYTPEFHVIWTPQGADIFLWYIGSPHKFDKTFIGYMTISTSECIVEVKPVWDQNNMERLFKLNQKWMWDRHRVFVNLVKPQELFARTFTPKEYLTTPSGRRREITKWEYRTLHQFLNNGQQNKNTSFRKRGSNSRDTQ
jgi:hypothetical protein